MNLSTRVDDPRHPAVVTVAAVNFAAVAGDRPATVAKAVERVRDAARQGAQLVVFPEGTFGSSGACRPCEEQRRPCTDHLVAAETVPGMATDALSAVARELDLHIVAGLDERVEGESTQLHNAAVLIGPEGIIGTYRKLHLGHPTESARFTPGDELPVFDTALGPIGILICYDFWSNPELTRILALKGARIVVNPTRSADQPGKADYVRNTTVVRAQENLIYTVSANASGPVGEGVSVGHSTIAGPAFPAFNHVYAESGAGEQTIVATLNFAQLGRWYDVFDWRRWRLSTDRQLAITALVGAELTQIASLAAEQERDR